MKRFELAASFAVMVLLAVAFWLAVDSQRGADTADGFRPLPLAYPTARPIMFYDTSANGGDRHAFTYEIGYTNEIRRPVNMNLNGGNYRIGNGYREGGWDVFLVPTRKKSSQREYMECIADGGLSLELGGGRLACDIIKGMKNEARWRTAADRTARR